MLTVPFTGSLQTAVQVQTGSGQWANGIRLLNKAAPAANSIRPFVRPIAPVVGTALLAKAALVAGAFAVGYGIGTLLRNALLEPKLKPIDTSQPTNPDALPKWLKQDPLPSDMQLTQSGQMGTEGAEVWGYIQITETRVSGSGCGSPNQWDEAYKAKVRVKASGGQLQWRKGEPAENNCGVLSMSLYILKQMPESGKEEDAKFEYLAGQSAGNFNPAGGIVDAKFRLEWVPLGDPLPDYPLPIWEPGPETEPIPEVEPDSLPERPRTPVIAPPLPATVPDAEPLNDPERLAPPITIPAPAVPATAPAVKPAQAPTTTNETTNAGEIVPSKKPPVPTTPKDVHKIGNAGGRIAGRTMRPTPVGIAQEVGRIEQKIAGMNRDFPTFGGLADILRLLLGLNELLNSQKFGTTYELKSVCECPSDDEDCEEETTTVSTAGGYYVDEILARIDAIPQLLQAHKDYKQPICNEKPCLEGDFRTISFISDERSPYGNSRLRKRFRYRSQSGIGLAELVEHWKDFTWISGDVCVQHSGHSWGTPQVWASSADEGKRVIQHAGREAGIDPDQVGKWTVGGSNNPRYGVSGTMRVNTKGGYYWITERLGSDGKPLVVPT